MPRKRSTPRKKVYMGSTYVPASQTAAEVVAELVKAGSRSINTDYAEGGKISGIRWIMRVRGSDVLFDMPIRIEPVHRLMGGRLADKDQAERTAWRQLLRWVQAQNCMIEQGMAEAGEVYLAYMVNPATSQTLFQHMVETQFKMLPAPSKLV